MAETLFETIFRNFAMVQGRIGAAIERAGRSVDSLQLVVVTKAQPVEVIEAVLLAGGRVLGENYPEESLGKIQKIAKRYPVEWHMIGHLQSRKAKIVAKHFDMMQSLDSLEIALKLNRLAGEFGRKMPVLLECNVSGEESKYGWNARDEGRWGYLAEEFGPLLDLPNLSIRGLMTMPPYYENPELARPYFQRMHRLKNFLNDRIPRMRLDHLSMGTSTDFEVAIEEGATIVRIGTAIVGSRPDKLV